MSSSQTSNSTGLQRSTSKHNLVEDHEAPSYHNEPQKPRKGLGLRRSTSRPNLLGSKVDLSSLGSGGSSGSSGGLGMRRTGSKMSLSDLVSKSKPGETANDSTPSLVKPSSSTSQLSKETEDSSAIETSESTIPSPPVSPGMPRLGLHRSQSMNNFENLKAPAISEGQRAVEQITGKVGLPKLPRHDGPGNDALPPAPSSQTSTPSSTSSSSAPSSAAAPHVPSPPNSEAPTPSIKTHEAYEHSPQKTQTHSKQPSPQQHQDKHQHKQAQPAPASLINQLNHHVPGHSPRDDGDARPEADSRVDYFSHNWNEADIAGSWRYVVSRRQDMANSARLENASWRMWAKAKNNLKTVDPSTVNWLKDYDVTWLYGPLYHESENDYQNYVDDMSSSRSRSGSIVSSSGQGTPDILPSAESSSRSPLAGSPHSGSSTAPTGQGGHSRQRSTIASFRDSRHSRFPNSNDAGFYPKSILKKKTLAQLMLEEAQELDNTSHMRSSSSPSHSKSTANYIRHHQYRPTPQGHNRKVVANILNRQYSSPHASDNDGMTNPQSPEKVISPTGSTTNIANTSSPSLSSKVSAVLGSSSSSSTPDSSRGGSQTNSRQGSQLSFRARPGSLLSLRSGSYSSAGDRRVHFNDRVEQCIAVDPSQEEEEDGSPHGLIQSASSSLISNNSDSGGSTSSSSLLGANSKASNSSASSSTIIDDDDDEDDEDDDDEDDDDDDEGGGLFLGLRRPSVLDMKGHDERPHIIAALPATTLRVDDDSNSDEASEHEDDYVYEPVAVSSSRRPGFNAQYAPHPVQKYEIVDPEIHPVQFEAKGTDTQQKPKRKIQPTASFG